ncbi:TIGR02300 family protein [Sandarakinorhabdus glacialis]|uniref:TIGR02300 family protein n=1 Tax=Sandarakinorhabdus glacialis TaxID=1614636 RepID=UPI00166A9754|nr:TIGR02300 family protein [Polymorphobacter glacialis]
MVKAEWGTKRACPKCNTRFYDLTKDEPVTCIACGYAWAPEPMLKSKQTTPFEQAKPTTAAEGADGADTTDEELDIEAAEAEDAEVPGDDLGDDDDLSTVVTSGDDEES